LRWIGRPLVCYVAQASRALPFDVASAEVLAIVSANASAHDARSVDAPDNYS
jgi:hypothetical protein